MRGNETGAFTDTEWSNLVEGLSLSQRQAEISKCLFQNMSDGQIAAELGISVPTVRTHLSRLFDKLGAEDRSGVLLCVVSTFRQECRCLSCPRSQ